MRKRTRVTALLGLLAWPALSGCGGGGGGGGSSPAPASPIVGTFRESSISGNGQSITCPGTVTLANGMTDSCGASNTFQFRQDGTFTASVGTVSFSGTYQFNGSTLSVTVTAPAVVAGRTDSGPVVFSNNNNTLTFPGASATDSTDVYTRQ